MLRSIRYPAMPRNPVLVRGLMIGKLMMACLTLGGDLIGSMAALGQTPPPPSDEVDLNAVPTVVNGRISRPTLQPGSQGEAVIELQSVLLLLGYYSGPVSGVYQDDTQAAVQQFQADAGINPDGIVGPATWTSLFPAPPNEANPPGTASAAPPASATTTPSAPTSPSPAQPTPEAETSNPEVSTPETTSPPDEVENTATSLPAERPVLRLGERGNAVQQLQTQLRSLGFYDGPIDGIFGAQTEDAVKQAQSANNLTVDGVVGPATWSAIY